MNNFQKNYSTGEVEVVKGDSRSCIYHKTEYRERRNHYAVYAVNAACDGFDTARESFLGTYGSPAAPQSVGNGTSCNSVADGWQPCGSFRLDITLEPHESRDFIFMLGYIENPADDKWEAPQIINKKKANELMEHFLSIKDFDNALLRLKDYWSHLLSGYTLEAMMRNSAAWSISGTSISAWLLLICPAPHLILNRVSAEAWDLGIPARICLALST